MEASVIIYLIAYMFIYSFIGWILESVYKTFLFKKIVNSGFLVGPVCPIYGFGAAIMYVCLSCFRDNILVLFFTGMIILSVWEYIAGIILEKAFKTKYWDYSENKFNFQGRLCLENSLEWGVLGVLFIKIIHPILEENIVIVPMNVLISLDVVFMVIFIIDIIYSVIKVKDINIGIDKLVEITDTIKMKMDELKTLTGKANEKSRESLSALIEELKQRQDSLKDFLSNKMSRLKMAFPDMKSERLSKLLSKKIDIIGKLKNESRNTKKDKK